MSKKQSLRDIALNLRLMAEEGTKCKPVLETDLYTTGARLEHMLEVVTPASTSTIEAKKYNKFAVSTMAFWVVKLVAEVRRLRKVLEEYHGS